MVSNYTLGGLSSPLPCSGVSGGDASFFPPQHAEEPQYRPEKIENVAEDPQCTRDDHLKQNAAGGRINIAVTSAEGGKRELEHALILRRNANAWKRIP